MDKSSANYYYGVFAKLQPFNVPAIQAFEGVMKAISQEPDRYQHQRRFISTGQGRIPIRELLLARGITDVSLQSPGQHHTSGTSAEVPEADELASTGHYEFALRPGPEIKKLGWRASCGKGWGKPVKGITGATELLLATPETADHWGIQTFHGLFNILADTGAFGFRSLQPTPNVALGSTPIVKKDGFFALNNDEQMITIGKLKYRLRYSVSDDEEKAFQAAKALYMTDILDMEGPIESTSITPSLHNMKIQGWTVLKAAGEGASFHVKAAIDDKGGVVAVHMLRQKTHGRPLGARIELLRTLKDRLALTEHGGKVQQILDDIPSTPDASACTFLLSTPLARGTFETLVMNAELSFDVKLQLFAQACAGVSAMHDAHFIHAGIGPSTLGVVSLDPPRAAILGTHESVDVRDQPDNCLDSDPGFYGTLGYQAPELGSFDTRFEFKVDCWSLGVVAFDLFSMEHSWACEFDPWREGMDEIFGSKKVDEDIREFELCRSLVASQGVKDDSINAVIARLLEVDPDDRLTSQELTAHPALAQWLTEDE